MPKKTTFPKDVELKILELYNNGNSMNLISKEFSVYTSVIKRILIENSIEISDNNKYKSKPVNENFFNLIDTEEKAYILGFIYADGYITKNIFGIKVGAKDIEIINKIKNALNSEHKIGVYKGMNGFSNGEEYCSINISNHVLVNDLIDKGVVYNKSKILKFPTTEQVPEHLVRHFIRGYFDGDGSIYYTTSNKYSDYIMPCISMVGTEHILENILHNLKQITNTKSNVYKYKNKDIYDLKIGGINMVYKIYDYLYADATIFLERKRDKFIEIFDKSFSPVYECIKV